MQATGGILFLEDVGTHPYQWDRMLHHLKAAGLFERASGIVIGDMEKCVQEPGEAELLELAVLHALQDFAGPVAIGLRCGHVDGLNLTMPLGIEAELDLSDASRPRMEFREAAVQG
jgi:muramoyltetrapeptide carboxypeptidase